MLNRLKGTLGQNAAGRIYTAAIRPPLEYACVLWSGGNTLKLEKLQGKFCRQHQLVLPLLSSRFDYHTLIIFFKIKCEILPAYVSCILPPSFKQTSTFNLWKTVYPVPQVKKKLSINPFPTHQWKERKHWHHHRGMDKIQAAQLVMDPRASGLAH